MKIKVKIIELCGETALDEDNYRVWKMCSIIKYSNNRWWNGCSPDKPQMFNMPHFEVPEAENE